MSKTPCWDEKGGYGACPEEMKSMLSQRPSYFYSLLRHPRDDPTPVMWEAVRREWNVLEGVPDEELFKNLVAVRSEFVDTRFL